MICARLGRIRDTKSATVGVAVGRGVEVAVCRGRSKGVNVGAVVGAGCVHRNGGRLRLRCICWGG